MAKDYRFTCYFDGACAPCNPGGHLGMGMIIFDSGRTAIYRDSKYRKAKKENTNNIAEYGALYYVLKYLSDKNHFDAEVIVRGDSQLVIKQMSEEWKIKDGAYRNGALHCKEMVKLFSNIRFEHIPREQNTLADDLSNKLLIQNGVKPFEK